MAHKWAGQLHYPCHLGGSQRFRAGDLPANGPQRFKAGEKSQLAHKWARWLQNPRRPLLGAANQARVVAAILNATPSTPPNTQLVFSDVPSTAVGHMLRWGPVSDMPAGVQAPLHGVTLSQSTKKMILAAVMQATPWTKLMCPGPLVFPLPPGIREDTDGEVCPVCGAHLPVSRVQTLVALAASDSGLAMVLSQPSPFGVLYLLGWEPRWMHLGDLDLWVMPGTYVGDLRPPR